MYGSCKEKIHWYLFSEARLHWEVRRVVDGTGEQFQSWSRPVPIRYYWSIQLTTKLQAAPRISKTQ